MTVPSQYKGFSKLPEEVQRKMSPELAEKYNMGGDVLQRPLFRQMGGPADAMPANQAMPPAPMPMAQGPDPMLQQAEAQMQGVGEQFAQQTMANIDQAQDIEGAINALRGNAKPIEARYDELAGFVGQGDAQQTPESVLAMVQPTIMMTEQGAMDSGIGQLIQSIAGSDMETPTGEPTAMGQGVGELMAMGAGNTPPVNFNQGGPVEVRRYAQSSPDGVTPIGADAFKSAFEDSLGLIQAQSAGILGTPEERARELEEAKRFQRGQAGLDLAKFGLALASPTDQPMSFAEKLAAAGQPLATSLGERAQALQDIKRAQTAEERALAMQNVGAATNIAGQVYGKIVEQGMLGQRLASEANLLTQQLDSKEKIAMAKLELEKNIFEDSKFRFDRTATLEENKLAYKKVFDEKAEELQKFLARFKLDGDIKLSELSATNQKELLDLKTQAQEKLAKVQGQIFLDNQLEIAGANNSFTLEKMEIDLSNAKELAKTNAEINKSAENNRQIFQASQNALNRVLQLRIQNKSLTSQELQNQLNRELQKELAGDANALNAAQFRMNFLLKERGLTIEQALAEHKVINEKLLTQIEAEKAKLKTLGTSLDGLANNMVAQEDKIKDYADGTLQGTDLNLFEQAITHLGSPTETIEDGKKVIKPAQEFNANLIDAFEKRIENGLEIPNIARQAVKARAFNKTNLEKFNKAPSQIAVDALLKTLDIGKNIDASDIFGRNAFFKDLANIGTELFAPGFTMFDETKVAKDVLNALNLATIQVFRGMPNFRDSVFSQKKIEEITAKPAKLLQGPNSALSKVKALINTLTIYRNNLETIKQDSDVYIKDFGSMAEVNQRKLELEGLINRYELFIGKRPTQFGEIDIGSYLNLDEKTPVEQSENSEIVNKALEIIKKKKKKKEGEGLIDMLNPFN